MISKESKENSVGRKWFDGKDEKDIISKCESVWILGGTDGEACFYANISTSSLSRYLKDNPDVKELRDRMKENPILEARRSVVNGLKASPELALKFLERRKKDEFSPRTELSGPDGKDLGVVILPPKQIPKEIKNDDNENSLGTPIKTGDSVS